MIRLIAAIDQKRGLAKAGRQPWNIPPDERYFQQQTHKFGGNILMGRKTYDVIGHPLAGRTNYVLSHVVHKNTGIVFVTDLAAFLSTLTEDVWVMGGATVYEQTVALADELYLTHIEADFGCDQFFPGYDQAFELTDKSPLQLEADMTYWYALYRPRIDAG